MGCSFVFSSLSSKYELLSQVEDESKISEAKAQHSLAQWQRLGKR
jgi:hypothetical protein